jgi:hypothetical protein
MASHRTFTDDEVAGALATLQANGGNAKRTADTLGISRTTLRGWAGRHDNTPQPKQVSAELVRDKSVELANNLEALALKSVGLADEKVVTASYKDLLIGAGIAIEKVQLLRGRPTQRTESLKISLVVPGGLRSLARNVIEGDFRQIPAKTGDVTDPESLG